MSSFFTVPASQRKRKRPDAPSSSLKRRSLTTTGAKPAPAKSKSSTRANTRDESISASDSESGQDNRREIDYQSEADSSSGGDDETVDERRLRLAQRYLDNIREEVNEDPNAFDAADVDRDLIAERLKEDVKGTKGRLYKQVAETLELSNAPQTYFTHDQNGVTAVAAIAPHVFTVSRDGSLCKWELAGADQNPEGKTNIAVRKKPRLITRFRAPRSPTRNYRGHIANVLCIAASFDGKYLATGGSDNRLVIWDAAAVKPIRFFNHHRDSVLSVSFRRDTHTLYSASADRTCKVWSLEEGMMGYVQTLFGHQDHVADIAGLSGEKFVSVGSRDRTARLFKVIEEQQLVFRGGGGGGGGRAKKEDVPKFEEGSIDRVAVIDEETFITGSDNGSLSLWSVLRKKPVFTIPLAHGTDSQLALDEAYAEETNDPSKERPGREKPRWITALKTIPLSDIVVTGSWDGCIRIWRVSMDRRSILPVGVLGQPTIPKDDQHLASLDKVLNGTNGVSKSSTTKPIRGIINDLALFSRGDKGKEGLTIIAAVSKTHRLGGWQIAKRIKDAKNGAVVFQVNLKDAGNGEEETMDDKSATENGAVAVEER